MPDYLGAGRQGGGQRIKKARRTPALPAREADPRAKAEAAAPRAGRGNQPGFNERDDISLLFGAQKRRSGKLFTARAALSAECVDSPDSTADRQAFFLRRGKRVAVNAELMAGGGREARAFCMLILDRAVRSARTRGD